MDDAELKQDIKEIKTRVAEIAETLIRNTASLEIHEHRTTLAEKRIESLEKWLIGLLTSGLLAVGLRVFLH